MTVNCAATRNIMAWERMNRFEAIREIEEAILAEPIVLIVDDDPAAQLALSALLGEQGYEIHLVGSAEEARASLAAIRPDVILCDLVMKGSNGDEFCSWLKAHAAWRYVPVIAVTRVDNPIATAAILDAGADDVIVKPASSRELRARVGAALRTRDRYLDLARRRTGVTLSA